MNTATRIAVCAAIFTLTLILGGAVIQAKQFPGRIALIERQGRIKFDALSGYRYGSVFQFSRFKHGKPVLSIQAQMNRERFHNLRDFKREKTRGTKRFLVLGDSFSAGYNDRPWVVQAERILKEQGYAIELMNLSLAGIGLANWHQLLTKFWKQGQFEIDGVIFPVFSSDLRRPFIIRHCNEAKCSIGSVGWHPEQFPKSLAEAKKLLKPVHNVHVLANLEYETAVANEQWNLFSLNLPLFFETLENSAQHIFPRQKKPLENQARRAMVKDIAATLEEHQLPVLVFQVCSSWEAISKKAPTKEMEKFANLIGANFQPSLQIYTKLSKQAVKSLYYTKDAHWNQKGADHFATFAAQHIIAWSK